jgi:hypothetical protein
MTTKKKSAAAKPRQGRKAKSSRRTPPVRLPRNPKGRRAQFYEDPAIDQLMAIVVALTAEFSVAFERMDTIERLLERSSALDRADIEGYLPDESVAAERFRNRDGLIQRVFQVLSQYERSR